VATIKLLKCTVDRFILLRRGCSVCVCNVVWTFLAVIPPQAIASVLDQFQLHQTFTHQGDIAVGLEKGFRALPYAEPLVYAIDEAVVPFTGLATLPVPLLPPLCESRNPGTSFRHRVDDGWLGR
jgi:hypothetical protein